MSLAWGAYRLAAPLIGAAAPAARALVSSAERGLWDERLGCPSAHGPADAWIHAASLGEALAVGPLVRELEALGPGARFHLTAATRGGRGRLAALGHPHSLAPLDAPQAVARFLAAVKPRRLLLVETELWPHWLLAAAGARIPVAVVSARLSAGSVPRYRRLGPAFRALVAGLDAVLCQGASDELRWRALGAPADRSAVTGNLKDDGLPAPVVDRAAAREAAGLDPARPLLVLGSLRPGEARILARAWRGVPADVRGHWQVVAVPRHPRAAGRLRREARVGGVPEYAAEGDRAGAWRWDATLGALPGYYAAADLAVIGGTLAPFGGHNPLEAAARGVGVIVGPYHAAQDDAVAALAGAGGARVVTGEAALAEALAAWLGDETARCAAGAAGLAVVRVRRGAARRTALALAERGLWPPT